jgi:hypothetical protein
MFACLVPAALGLMLLAAERPVIGQGAPVLRILVTNNYPDMSSRMLQDAKTVVTTLYRTIGIQIEWADALDPEMSLIVAFPPPGGAERMALDTYVLGHTYRSIAAEPGGRALIFVDRIERRARAARIDITRLLGAVIAHEIGHMLLRSAHTQTGLMRAHWGDHDLQLIDMGGLRFTASEPELMRRQLRRRPAMDTF